MNVIFTYVQNLNSSHYFNADTVPAELISLASYLDSVCKPVVLNKNDDSLKKTEKLLADLKPDLIYIHIYTHNRLESLKLVRDIKRVSSVPVVAGGPFVTFLSNEIVERFQEIDYLLRGEPEILLERVIKALVKNKAESLERVLHFDRLKKTNSIPSANEFEGQLLNVNKNEQFKFILTSRGSLSDNNLIPYSEYSGKELRPRSVRKTVSEIVNLQKKYGLIYFIMRDEDFLVDRERTSAFCRELARRKLFIMWQCFASVNNVDEDVLNEMKAMGLERIWFNVFSGSPTIMKRYSPDVSRDAIINAVSCARKVGLYVSIRLFTGFPEETYADIKKTHSLISKIKPGECRIYHLHYYPGTTLYNDALIDKKITPAMWFRQNQPDLYVREDPEVESWIDELAHVSSLLRYKTWYTAKDFKKHRKVNAKNCWVTDILEGDYYYDEEQYNQADRFYRKVITAYPKNPWGYMRMGKIKFTLGSFPSAEQYFRTVIDLVPEYFGAYLKTSQCLIAQNRMREGRRFADEAYKRNRHDLRIQNIRDAVRH